MLDQLCSCNFGPGRSNATGSTGVGYSVLDTSGSLVSARTTAGVYQLVSGSGLYSAYVSFPDNFRGQIMWDTGAAFSSTHYAVEQFNIEANNPNVNQIAQTVGLMSGTLSQLYKMNYGRWKIVGTQMIFYSDDNVTEISRFNLFDDLGAASNDSVFERVKV